MLPLLVVVAACAWTMAIYWPGLDGPMLFDDYGNLVHIEQWLRGEIGLESALLPNPDSIVFSRPLAMATFALTAWLQEGTFALKLGNLVLHLSCALVAWRLLRRAFLQDLAISRHAAVASAVAVGIWLIHPSQVSTVLYGVQRMAQLSALFSLLVVWAYMVGRDLLVRGDKARGLAYIFGAVPILCLAGLLSKQNAAVAPLLCLALEVAYFKGSKRPAPLRAFFLLFVGLPAVLVALALLAAPHRLLAGYGELEFGLAERLLTQPVALVDYVGAWLVPQSSRMGFYTDAFPISTGLLTPPTTVIAIGLLVLATVAAIALRRRSRTVLAGWLFFLAAHTVESSFLPIEMYYEHRNYLPSFGLMMVLVGAIGALAQSPRLGFLSRRIHVAVALAFAVALSISTFGRVLVWQDEIAMTEQGIRHHPDSLRVRQDRVALALRSGNFPRAWETVLPMLTSDNPRFRLVGRIDAIAITCSQGETPDIAALADARRYAQKRLTVYEVHGAHLLETATRHASCDAQLPATAADLIVHIIDAASDQPPYTANKSLMRRIAGQLYARAGDWVRTMEQSEYAWEGEQTLPSGSLLVRSYVRNGRAPDGRRILQEMNGLRGSDSPIWATEMAALRDMIDRAASSHPAIAPHRSQVEQ